MYCFIPSSFYFLLTRPLLYFFEINVNTFLWKKLYSKCFYCLIFDLGTSTASVYVDWIKEVTYHCGKSFYSYKNLFWWFFSDETRQHYKYAVQSLTKYNSIISLMNKNITGIRNNYRPRISTNFPETRHDQ